jgi:prevent-host-death family protein
MRKPVSVSDLKRHLSRYLGQMQRGQEVPIARRGLPIARLVPIQPAAATDRDHRARLVARGVITPGTGDCSAVLSEPPLEITGAQVGSAVMGDRDDRV